MICQLCKTREATHCEDGRSRRVATPYPVCDACAADMDAQERGASPLDRTHYVTRTPVARTRGTPGNTSPSRPPSPSLASQPPGPARVQPRHATTASRSPRTATAISCGKASPCRPTRRHTTPTARATRRGPRHDVAHHASTPRRPASPDLARRRVRPATARRHRLRLDREVAVSTAPIWLSTDEAAALLDLPASTVRTYAARGVLRCRRIGRTVQVSSASVRAYQERRKGPGRPAKAGSP